MGATVRQLAIPYTVTDNIRVFDLGVLFDDAL